MFRDSKDDEKFKNLILFNFYGTDDEVSKFYRILLLIILFLIIIIGAIFLI
jgi:hypothetical protein